MTFAELTSELVARGAVSDSTRNGRWINVAYRRIGNAYDWPFTEAVATGATGAGSLQLTDFRKAQYVGDLAQTSGVTPGFPLARITPAELAEEYGISNLAAAGTPSFWWLDTSVGPALPNIRTYPLGGTVYVRYQKRLDELAGSQAPVFDEEYHSLIVDRAMVEVYRDADEQGLAKDLMNQFREDLASMAQDYEVYSRQGSYIQVVDPTDG